MSLIEVGDGSGFRNLKKPIKMAVIGVGAMGQHHLRICSLLREINLVAVVDVDEARAKQSADRYGCEAYTQLEDLIGKVDAAIIAVPSGFHAKVGGFCLNNNIHCLIEKPLATTEEDCRRLIKLSKDNNKILLAGHVERFNPGIQKLAELVSTDCEIQAIEAKRLGLNLNRSLDVDVIIDLMMHDLDIVLSLVKKPLIDLSVHTLCPHKVNQPEHATASLVFSDSYATVTASRMTQNKVRTLEMTTSVGHITLNYLTHELYIHQQIDPESKKPLLHQRREQVFVRPIDALTAEIQNFVQSIHAGTPLGVTGVEALEALKLVWKLQEAFRSKNNKQETLV
jgi:virulence factor